MLTSLFYRIPSGWIGLVFSGLVLWVYLRWFDKISISSFLRDLVWGVILVFVVFSRFLAGLILHPSTNLREDFLAVLSGAPVYGWIVGLAATLLYGLWRLYRQGLFKPEVFSRTATVFYLGGAVFFLYLSLANLMPFRMQYLIRSVVFLFLFLLSQNQRLRISTSPQLKWGLAGVALLATTVLVPQVTHVVILSAEQWVYLFTILIALGSEAFRDVRRSDEYTMEQEDGYEPESK